MMINSMTHSLVLAVQLIIGNIEANPGPIDGIKYMAELIANVVDEQIMKVLQQFKTCQDRKTHVQNVENRYLYRYNLTVVPYFFNTSATPSLRKIKTSEQIKKEKTSWG